MIFIGLPMLLLLGCAADPVGGEFSVLTYNVHGLPSTITGDDTTARMGEIAPRLAEFDVIGLQEDWMAENHQILDAAVPHPARAWFSTIVDDRVYGAGLATYSVFPVTEQVAEHYTTCWGTLDGASDCLASKGFQVFRVWLADGVAVDVYNSHLEAGSGAEDDASRSANVDQLIASMNGFSADHAVLFMGDTNLEWADPEDAPELERWLADAALNEACTLVDCPEPDHIDRILVRDGPDVRLTVTAWDRREEFVDAAGTDLSDHPAITATIQWSQR